MQNAHIAGRLGRETGTRQHESKTQSEKAAKRDWLVRGRVRVMLKNPDGTFVHNEVQTKKQIMIKMGELIPKLKHRVNPPKDTADKKESKKEKKN